ncbi:MAG TPA: GtrA family protein [Candidatus Limiplasma sp.]|nr:GtrA family protein [Candidatus Limiplasma sp.]
MQKLKALYTEKHKEIWELVRYVIAGGLTTLVSLIVSNGCYFIMAVGGAPAAPGGGFGALVAWVIEVINRANAAQTSIGTAIAWVVAVVFAFWINRWMVFRVTYTAWRERLIAFFQFTGARVLSFLLFEEGVFQLLKLIGVENFINRILVLVLVMVFNYVASKFWVFKEKAPEKAQNGPFDE